MLKFPLISVKISNREFPLLVSKINPDTQSKIPIITSFLGGFFSKKVWKNGVKITNAPVINADFVAVVYFNPIVCVENPTKYISPSNVPSQRTRLLNDLNNLKAKGRRITVANKNLTEIKNKGEISVKTDFTTTKVAPHIKVIVNRIISGKKFFMKGNNLLILPV